MKYLLYCICQQDVEKSFQEPGIHVVAGHGLAVVVSQVEVPNTVPNVSALLAYEKVVERIHAVQDVIPLRYGCLMENEEQIVRLLEYHRQEYEALLTQLRGMTEMGIRLLWPEHAVPLPSHPLSPGAAYLASIRSRHNTEVALAPEESLLADQIAALLARWSSGQRRAVTLSPHGRLLSLCFLTPKSCIEEFRKKAREISLPRDVKILLSGPWPPYNFVVSSV
jgi:hypothetical protein